MTQDEMEDIARRVATSVVSELSRSSAAPSTTATDGITLGAQDDEASCFTCSGRFRCRPSFLIQAESA